MDYSYYNHRASDDSWTSIGKPILIYDAMIAIAFISFIKNQNNTNLKILLISLILSICIKITALISVFPIIVLLLLRYWKNLLDIIFNATNRDIILIGSSLFLLFTSFMYRIELWGNPIFPLFPEIFNPGRSDLIRYNKHIFTDGFPIFFTGNPGYFGLIIGPVPLLLSIFSFYYAFARKKIYEEHIISISIFFVIFFLAHKRADYLFIPLILTLITFPLTTKQITIAKYLSITQASIISIAMTYLIYQNF